VIDLRSDTVTRPSDGMRQAMAQAEVGDDVYGEDPTVNRLQDTVADLLGKEAALFVPSGVMANQIAIKLHTTPGDEVILNRRSHIYNYESGAPSLLAGVQLAPIDSPDVLLHAAQVEAAIRPEMDVFPQTRLVCVENTLNKGGGRVYPLERLEAIAGVAQQHGLALHLDGARLWNAAAASGVAERAYAAQADTVWVALSKGLGAPVGSVLAGPSDAMDRARRYRKLFGGGMRQAGVLAAAGLYAIEHHRPTLGHDHEKARRLAEGVAELPGFSLDPSTVDTNIVLFDVKEGTAASVLEPLREEGVLMTPFGPSTVRATTHRDVSMDDIDAALSVLRARFSASPSA
jgi:threonine aldolase